MRVLLVEDEAVISVVTSILLEDAGYHVTVATDGQQGLEIALQDSPKLIISDYMMPRMDGLEMITRLRQRGFTGPVLLTTAIPEEHFGNNPGYSAYLSKPYYETELLRVVQQLMPER